MCLSAFVLLAIVLVGAVITWRADCKWRSDNNILPMTDQDREINEELRRRRK